MLKHALNYWNIRNTDELDPVVKLILEALSSELFNIEHEIKDVQVRILEKIAGLLTPDFLTSPNPAHAMLYAEPLSASELLETTASFAAQHKFSSRHNDVLDTSLECSFGPVAPVRIFDVQVSLMATGGNLYQLESISNKQLLAQAARSKPVDYNTLWLGLKVNPLLESLDNLFFFFDWKNMEPAIAGQLYELLPLVKWHLNDKPLQTVPGLAYFQEPSSADAYQAIFANYDLLPQVERDIRQYYDQMFVTLTGRHPESPATAKKPYPEAFNSWFTGNELQQLTEPLVWLKLVFPPRKTERDFLNDVYVYPNAFPVMNRKLNDLKYRLKGGSNIIPLKTDQLDQFLSVKSLTDEIHEYHPVPHRISEGEAVGTYALRYGGVERFDSRNAREMIGYLMELLRSESAAFAAYGYDFIATLLKEMNQRIALMEQRTQGYINNAVEVPSYIIVKPLEGRDMMFAEYWTTLAEAANGLRAGTKLQALKSNKLKQNSISLLTSSMGGKNRLKPEERLSAFRYGITSRDRIVTKEDIRNFCFYDQGSRIRQVYVEKGIEVSANPQESFKKTIDVILVPDDKNSIDSREWLLRCEQLKSKLQTRSGMSNHYRVKIHETAEQDGDR